MVLYPKPHDKIVISWNQLQQTTDTIQKILCLIRNCNSVEDTEEKNLLDSFDLGCFDNPTVVLRVLDCLNEVIRIYSK